MATRTRQRRSRRHAGTLMSQAHVVRVVEDSCIGCTKCIQVCPVDCIIGAAKQMHTVLTQECIGCDLCIPACPMDCIEIAAAPALPIDKSKSKQRAQLRKARTKTQQLKKRSIEDRKAYIKKAMAKAEKPS